MMEQELPHAPQRQSAAAERKPGPVQTRGQNAAQKSQRRADHPNQNQHHMQRAVHISLEPAYRRQHRAVRPIPAQVPVPGGTLQCPNLKVKPQQHHSCCRRQQGRVRQRGMHRPVPTPGAGQKLPKRRQFRHPKCGRAQHHCANTAVASLRIHCISSGSSSVKLPSLPPRNSSSKILAIRSVSTSPPEIKKPRFFPAASSRR